MTPSRHHYPGCPRKQATRQRSLDAAQECPALWDRQQNRLGVDWLEITGKQDPTLRMLLNDHILHTGGKYIGVNGPFPPATPQDAREVLQGNQALYHQETAQGLCAWHYGLLQDVLSFDSDTYRNVGVIVADTSESVGSRDTIHTLAPIFKFARDQAEHLGQCLLMVNTSYRGAVGGRLKKAKARWLKELGEACGVGPIPEQFSMEYRNKGNNVSMLPVWVVLGGG